MPRKRITDEQLAEAVKESFSVMGVLEYLGLRKTGGGNAHYKKRIDKLGLDTSHFTGRASNRGKQFNTRKSKEEILVYRTSGTRQKSAQLVRALIESGVKHECKKCGNGPEWMGNVLTLDVDHINENWLDDRIENLRFLCPNCHSQFSRKLLGN